MNAAAADDHREAADSVKSADPTDMSEDDEVLHPINHTEGEASGQGRTRHIVRFHGEKWANVLAKKRADIEAAFLKDIYDCAGVKEEEAKRLKIKMHEFMEVTFVVYSESRARQKKIHAALRGYNFPSTCGVYTSFAA